MQAPLGRFVVVLTAILFFFCQRPAIGIDTYWRGDEGDWHDSKNWTATIPSPTVDAFINNYGTAQIFNADASAKNLTIGENETEKGHLQLVQNYKLTLAEYLLVGRDGEGSVYQSSGLITATTQLALGYESTGSGSYVLQQGTLTVGEPGKVRSMLVGRKGDGTFQHTNGDVTVYGNLTLGYLAGAQGEYTLENGSLTVEPGGYFTVGRFGNSNFYQKNGEVVVKSNLLLGSQTGSQGNYFLNDGNLTVGQWEKSATIIAGAEGMGNFYQDGGTVTVNGDLALGNSAGTASSYILTKGSLTVNKTEDNSSHLYVGHTGKGDFKQSGGEVVVHGHLLIGGYSSSDGTYSLSTGSLTVNQGGTLAVGWQGKGKFYQQGGEVAAHNRCIIGEAKGSQGWYILDNGIFTVGEVDGPNTIYVGQLGTGTFQQHGGEATIYGDISVNELSTFKQTGGTFLATQKFINQGQVIVDNSTHNPLATNLGMMTNKGSIKITEATVTFQSYTGSGSYISDPATTIILENLEIEPTGYLQGGRSDIWRIGNDFLNTSTQDSAWNTTLSTLVFFKSETQDTVHTLQIPGLDKGPGLSGAAANFAWGTLDLTGQDVSLLDAGESGGALYLQTILGLEFDPLDPLHILNLHCPSGLKIYYDLAFNPGLSGIYFLDGGGSLVPLDPGPPAPLPGSFWLLLTGFAMLPIVRHCYYYSL